MCPAFRFAFCCERFEATVDQRCRSRQSRGVQTLYSVAKIVLFGFRKLDRSFFGLMTPVQNFDIGCLDADGLPFEGF